MEENYEGETKEETEKYGHTEDETERFEERPLQNPLREDELAQIMANMGEYAQPLSPLNHHTDEGLKKHSAHDKNTSEEMSN